ncbi:CST complex subunit CTC1 [Trifolium repens]|nr:CST complex subunit CTC1 [Trifolium repens]
MNNCGLLLISGLWTSTKGAAAMDHLEPETSWLHTLMHDLRVGSIITVRILFLGYIGDIIPGLCVRNSIIVESFSPLKTVYVCAFFFSSMFALYECSKYGCIWKSFMVMS